MAFVICIALALVATCYAEPVNVVSSSSPKYVCKSRNAYYSVEGSCDSYVYCRNLIPVTKTCPDGLHFNPDATYPNFPCGYPADVPCLGRSTVQEAQPTQDCPHQYGYFPYPGATPDSCGHYRMCIDGHAWDMYCPTGLAFNPDSGRCDWPHLVASCKANEYLGFSCPVVEVDDDEIRNYKYPGNCFYFYSCQRGHARLLACDEGTAFELASGRCVDESFVDCTQH